MDGLHPPCLMCLPLTTRATLKPDLPLTGMTTLGLIIQTKWQWTQWQLFLGDLQRVLVQ